MCADFINHYNYFSADTYPPRSGISVAYYEHEEPYHIAMLVALGEGYWWKERANVSSITPEGYYAWLNDYIKKHGLKQDYIEELS